MPHLLARLALGKEKFAKTGTIVGATNRAPRQKSCHREVLAWVVLWIVGLVACWDRQGQAGAAASASRC